MDQQSTRNRRSSSSDVQSIARHDGSQSGNSHRGHSYLPLRGCHCLRRRAALPLYATAAGSMMVVEESSPRRYQTIDTIQTAAGGHTLVIDSQTHKVYVVCSRFRGAQISDSNHFPVHRFNDALRDCDHLTMASDRFVPFSFTKPIGWHKCKLATDACRASSKDEDSRVSRFSS